MLIALLLITYLLPIIGGIVYCGYSHKDLDSGFMAMFIWPILLPFVFIFAIGRVMYLLGEWLYAPLGMTFWNYLIKNFF